MDKNIATDNYFGKIVEDKYRWLEDDNAPEVEEWVKQQNKRTEKFLSQIPFRNKIKTRLEKIWNYEKRTGLFKAGEYYYFFRAEGLQNQSIIFRQKNNEKADSQPEEFFNPNKLSNDGTIALKNLAFSEDGKKMAYSVSSAGSDWEEIFVFDAETKTKTNDHLKWIKFSNLAWYKDGFFYSAYDELDDDKAFMSKNEFQKIKYHKLGTDQKDDIIIFEDKKNPLCSFSADTNHDETILFIYAYQAASQANMLFIYDLKKGLPKTKENFIQYNNSFDDSVHPIDTIDDYLFLMTNKNAPFYKLVKTPISNPNENNVETVIEEKNYLLSSCSICGQTKNLKPKIVTTYLKDVQDEIYFYDCTGKEETKIALPKNGSIRISGAKKNEPILFFSFTSYTTPNKIIRYDIQKNELSDFFIPKIDIDIDEFKCEQVFYKSKDGTKVPMHIVSKKDIQLNGNNPTILYGYGGFGIPLLPAFSVSTITFLETGGIFVCANLRGGVEYGEDWHNAGKQLKKQNVFDDFISAAEFLIENKYTSSKKLAIQGGSNGGLLIGAVTNQRPDLFAVAIPQVGVLDMLRYHKFTIGWAWADEYGTSEDSKEVFENLYSYSPLHNITKNIAYPAIMVTTGDHDDRVVPAHSFKYAQALQDTYTGENPILIRINVNAGHGAGKPTAKIIEETADIYSFILYQTNHKI